ncbi:hypothetical protein [Streptosporangium sp. NPDC002524]|uniref:hypothetical protein n=1 Tax=Streptosporangium sp. NPDC002524 TaxID=3154537 RepID=UPI0033189004
MTSEPNPTPPLTEQEPTLSATFASLRDSLATLTIHIAVFFFPSVYVAATFPGSLTALVLAQTLGAVWVIVFGRVHLILARIVGDPDVARAYEATAEILPIRDGLVLVFSVGATVLLPLAIAARVPGPDTSPLFIGLGVGVGWGLLVGVALRNLLAEARDAIRQATQETAPEAAL